jgi:DHA1 family tetracycline resistance protein-like MFS transporter
MADVPPPPTSPSDPAPASKSALVIVFLVVVIDLLGFGIVLPLLPRLGDVYVKDLFAGGKESAHHPATEGAGTTPHAKDSAKGSHENAAGGAVLGSLMAVFSLMQFLFAPAWGRLSDRIGRRPVLLVGLTGSVIFYALLGYALSLTKEQAVLALVLLFVARAGAGVAGATIATAQAVIADCTPPEKRRHGMALIGAAFGIGFTFGPIIGWAALEFYPSAHWLVGAIAAVLSLTALIFALGRLPETRKAGGPRAARKLINFQAVRLALSSPAIAPVLWTFFLASFGFGSFETTLSLLLRDTLGLDPAKSYRVFAFIGLVLVLTQGVLYRRLANRVTEPTFIAMGLLLMGFGVLALGGISWLAAEPSRPDFNVLLGLTLAVLAVSVVGFAFLTPSAQALISRRSPPDRQGEILGVNQSASALARILGPLCGIPLYQATPRHLLPYVFGAALLLLMLPFLPRIRRGGPLHEAVAVPQ